jgi:hypothetical protein
VASVRIDDKYNGKRLCVSIDKDLYDIFSFSVNNPRELIRKNIANGSIDSTMAARMFIYKVIVKTSIMLRFEENNT